MSNNSSTHDLGTILPGEATSFEIPLPTRRANTSFQWQNGNNWGQVTFLSDHLCIVINVETNFTKTYHDVLILNIDGTIHHHDIKFKLKGQKAPNSPTPPLPNQRPQSIRKSKKSGLSSWLAVAVIACIAVFLYLGYKEFKSTSGVINQKTCAVYDYSTTFENGDYGYIPLGTNLYRYTDIDLAIHTDSFEDYPFLVINGPRCNSEAIFVKVRWMNGIEGWIPVRDYKEKKTNAYHYEQNCGLELTSRLAIDQRGFINQDVNPLNFLENPFYPGFFSSENIQIPTLTYPNGFTVLDGYICISDALWWKVTTDSGQIGWIAEFGNDGIYLISPEGTNIP